MAKHFFTPEFYSDPYLTRNVINELLDTELPPTFDYQYSPGYPVDMLSFNWSIEKVQKELGKLISDIPAYLEYHSKTHWEPEEDEIPLSALLIDYQDHYGITLDWKKRCELVKLSAKATVRKEVSHG